MSVSVIGINHKTAPIEIREKFYLTPVQQELLLSELRNCPSVVECLIISTCNRTEVYLHTVEANPFLDFLKIVFSVKNLKFDEQLSKHFYHYADEKAVRHLLRVTSGLESLVLGERQILGQVKEAVELARRKTMLGKYFNILSNMAVRAGKKAQTETHISFGGVSISWAAVNMAESVLGTLAGKSVLIIGAGKMGELATDQMKKKGVGHISVMNRTQSCADALAARLNGTAVPFCDIKTVLEKVDVCICSVSAPHYILEKSTVEEVMRLRNSQKLVFIDISMPRNIDPQVGQVPNVLLFHIDDLDQVVNENMKKREASISHVEEIIDVKVHDFYRKIDKLSLDRSSDYFGIKNTSAQTQK